MVYTLPSAIDKRRFDSDWQDKSTSIWKDISLGRGADVTWQLQLFDVDSNRQFRSVSIAVEGTEGMCKLHFNTPNPIRLKEIRCKARKCVKRNRKEEEWKGGTPFPRWVLVGWSRGAIYHYQLSNQCLSVCLPTCLFSRLWTMLIQIQWKCVWIWVLLISNGASALPAFRVLSGLF